MPGSAPEDRWLQIAQSVLSLITLVVVSWLGSRNHEAVKNVEANQQEVREKTDEATSRLKRVEKTTRETETQLADSVGPNLWAAAQYLKGIADETGSAVDKARAEDARRAYVEHMKRQTQPKNGAQP